MRGCVETLSSNQADGWAELAHGQPAYVYAELDGQVLGTARANQPRADLAYEAEQGRLYAAGFSLSFNRGITAQEQARIIVRRLPERATVPRHAMLPARQTRLDFPLFIVGSPRSGTSILAEALHHAGYGGHAEGNFLSLLQALGRAVDTHLRIFGTDDPRVLTAHFSADEVKQRIYLGFRDMIDAHYGATWWLDKTGNPEMIEIIPVLRALWPQSRFVFAKRRGIENIVSRLKKFPQLDFDYHCADWARNMAAWTRVKTASPDLPHIEIDQRDIANAPQAAAAQIAAFLGLPMPAQADMATIFTGSRPQQTAPGTAEQVLTLAGTGWTARQHEIFRARCGAQMAAFGYTEDEDYRAGPGPAFSALPPATAMQAAPTGPDPHDLSKLLEILHRDDVGFVELLKFYIDYQGRIYRDQIVGFQRKAKQLIPPGQAAIDIDAATRDRNADGLAILSQAVPGYEARNFTPAGNDGFDRVELLAAGPNELRDETLPPPLRWKLGMPQRPGFSAFTRQGGSLFVGPFQYQYFDQAEDIYFPDASSRQFSKSILDNPRRTLQGNVVVVQDPGSGSNFSHFACDWMTRIMYALDERIADTNSMFILGGQRAEFQETMIAALHRLYGISIDNFIFPESRMILDIDGPFTFFSDQRLQTMHPAQMAHPRSMAYLHELTDQIPGSAGADEKIFISRNDAYFRRISNQAELSEIAGRQGYRTVELARLKLPEQFTLFRGARQIVGAHGMGLTHLLFCRKPACVMELFHPVTGTDAFAMLAKARGFDHRFIIGQDVHDGRGSYAIDPQVFTDSLQAFDALQTIHA